MDRDIQKTGAVSQSGTPLLHVEFIGDVVCPFSFMARRRLDNALRRLSAGPAPRFLWQPFELNPDMPAEGLPLDAYLDKRFGDRRVIEPVLAQLVETGRFDDISFDFKNLKVVPNTLLAHRLIMLAGDEDCQEQLVDALYSGFFEQGLNIGDIDVLEDIAKTAGLKKNVRDYLESDAGVSVVRGIERQLAEAGVVSVPNVIFNGRVTVAGAQESETFLNAIDTVLFEQADGATQTGHMH